MHVHKCIYRYVAAFGGIKDDGDNDDDDDDHHHHQQQQQHITHQ